MTKDMDKLVVLRMRCVGGRNKEGKKGFEGGGRKRKEGLTERKQ